MPNWQEASPVVVNFTLGCMAWQGCPSRDSSIISNLGRSGVSLIPDGDGRQKKVSEWGAKEKARTRRKSYEETCVRQEEDCLGRVIADRRRLNVPK